jgi:hypothetical protein
MDFTFLVATKGSAGSILMIFFTLTLTKRRGKPLKHQESYQVNAQIILLFYMKVRCMYLPVTMDTLDSTISGNAI